MAKIERQSERRAFYRTATESQMRVASISVNSDLALISISRIRPWLDNDLKATMSSDMSIAPDLSEQLSPEHRE